MIIYGIDFGGGNCSDKCCRDELSNKCSPSTHIPVQLLPNLGDADRDHIYITQDNVAWIPNYDGTGWVKLSTGEQTPPLEEQPTTDDDINIIDKSFDRVTIHTNHILYNSGEQKFYTSDIKSTYDIPNSKRAFFNIINSHENLGEVFYGIKKLSDNEFLLRFIPNESKEVLWTKHTKEEFFSYYRYQNVSMIMTILFDSDEGNDIIYDTNSALFHTQDMDNAINDRYPIDVYYTRFNDDDGTVTVASWIDTAFKIKFSN